MKFSANIIADVKTHSQRTILKAFLNVTLLSLAACIALLMFCPEEEGSTEKHGHVS
jgi:hypothetical protein